MAQPQPSVPYKDGADGPPPPYPGTPYPGAEPTLNYPNHNQAPSPQGWGPYPPPPPPTYQYGSTIVTVQPIPSYPASPNTRVVILGNGCPRCQAGMLVDSFDCLGIFLAIFFFPIGILCCLAMRQKRCTNCGASF